MSPSNDPTIELWRRVRKPLMGLFLVVLVIGQYERLTSGELYWTLLGVALIAFWVTVMLRAGLPAGDRTEPGYWRARGVTDLKVWGAWIAVAGAGIAWGMIQHDLRPRALTALVLPTLLLLTAWFSYARAEKIAAAQAKAEGRVSA